MDIAYDGGPFRGFARQPDQRTVQGDLEQALSRLVGGDRSLTVAGRTDAGVHATGQVVNFPDLPDDDPVRLSDALNKMLVPAIAVTNARAVPSDFDARFSALSRTYVYALDTGRVHDPFRSRFVWHLGGGVDVDVMNEAAGHLVGERDFSSFGRLPDPDASGVRVLYELSCRTDGSIVRIKARANAFIQQMVRSLVGTLVQMGQGRRDPSEAPRILEARDRAAAGPVAPPQGLCLASVEYDEGSSPDPAFDPFG